MEQVQIVGSEAAFATASGDFALLPHPAKIVKRQVAAESRTRAAMIARFGIGAVVPPGRSDWLSIVPPPSFASVTSNPSPKQYLPP